MYHEDDLVQISALQHFIFCERQCALIHVEQLWNENVLTAEGRIMHEHVDTEHRETRGNVRIEFGMPLRSIKLGLVGKADAVEFHRERKQDMWVPFPVEYKRGKTKKHDADRIQLCAQGVCLEEMMNIPITGGALFYGETRHRYDVEFDDTLRNKTEGAVIRIRKLIVSGITPPPDYSAKCKKCSLVQQCLPKASKKASSYLLKLIEEDYESEP